ncbi:MAG TPA: HTH domain-containing protein [Marivirga sp.]|nr:HTH domain-containing protein [Marivirga sp.]
MSAGLKYFERLNYLSELIEKQKTGCAAQLANTFDVSERTIYRMIADVSSYHNTPIKFSKQKNSYILEYTCIY